MLVSENNKITYVYVPRIYSFRYFAIHESRSDVINYHTNVGASEIFFKYKCRKFKNDQY